MARPKLPDLPAETGRKAGLGRAYHKMELLQTVSVEVSGLISGSEQIQARFPKGVNDFVCGGFFKKHGEQIFVAEF